MDNSAKRTQPIRAIEVRKNHQGRGFNLVAVTIRPEGGALQTLLNQEIIADRPMAQAVAEATARIMSNAFGVLYVVTGEEYVGRNRLDVATMNKLPLVEDDARA